MLCSSPHSKTQSRPLLSSIRMWSISVFRRQLGIGASSTNLTVVKVCATKWNSKIWQHYNLCEMLRGPRKAWCNKSGNFFKEDGNIILRNHSDLSCKTVKFGLNQDQATMSNQSTVWMYNQSLDRVIKTMFVIQESWSFDLFDNPRLMELIQETIQLHFVTIIRTTLRRDTLNMLNLAKESNDSKFWKARALSKIKVQCLVGAPIGSTDLYLCVTDHWLTWHTMKHMTMFKLLGYLHSKENSYRILDYIITLLEFQNIAFSISFDYSSNNGRPLNKYWLKLYKKIDLMIWVYSILT